MSSAMHLPAIADWNSGTQLLLCPISLQYAQIARRNARSDNSEPAEFTSTSPTIGIIQYTSYDRSFCSKADSEDGASRMIVLSGKARTDYGKIDRGWRNSN
jgi:hypothetical protein